MHRSDVWTGKGERFYFQCARREELVSVEQLKILNDWLLFQLCAKWRSSLYLFLLSFPSLSSFFLLPPLSPRNGLLWNWYWGYMMGIVEQITVNLNRFNTTDALQSIFALRWFALGNFARTNVYNEVPTHRLAHHPSANSLVRILLNKLVHVLNENANKEHTTSLSQSESVKPKVHESIHLALCLGLHLAKNFALLLVCFQEPG